MHQNRLRRLPGIILAAAVVAFAAAVWSSLFTIRPLRQRAILFGHQAAVETLAFSPDGTTLASTALDDKLWLWDVATGKPRARADLERQDLAGDTGRSTPARFAPDGKSVAVARQREVRVFKTSNGWRLARLVVPDDAGLQSLSCVSYLPDGHTLFATTWEWGSPRDRDVRPVARYWDTQRWDELVPLKAQAALETFGHVTQTGDGRSVILAFNRSNDSSALELRDIASWERVQTFPVGQRFTSGAILSPDGRTVVTKDASDDTLHVWDAATGRERWQLPRTEHSPGSTNVLEDEQPKVDAHESGCAPFGALGTLSVHFRFSAEGSVLLMEDELDCTATPSLIDVPQGRVRRVPVSGVGAAALSPDGTRLALIARKIMLRHRWAAGLPKWCRRWLQPVTVRTDQVLVLDCRTDRLLAVHEDVEGPSGLRVTADNVLAWSPDGRTLANARSDGSIVLWHAPPPAHR
jgi:WD40 repeat protein